MVLKKFLKLCVVICIGLLIVPLLGISQPGYGAEVLENQPVNREVTAMSESQNEWNEWSSIDYSSRERYENHKILLTGNIIEPPAAVKSETAKAETHGGGNTIAMEDFLELAKYGKAIHLLAMVIIGFGFLMVFVKRYGYGAVTATYIAVSIVIPYYMSLKKTGVFGEPAELTMDRLIFAELCAASIMIAIGAFLGRLKMSQYIIMALIFVPSYMLNEWIMLDNGMDLIPKGKFIDSGGSVVIHQFGAYFGLGIIVRMTTSEDFNKKIESDKISNQFSMLGSMVLWVFWPSFCATTVEVSKMPLAAVNTILSLCGATIATYIASTIIRKKIAIEDMANAALAGGVVIGSSCVHATSKESLILGLIAGTLSVVGFTIIQPHVQRLLKGIDTCGINNLHGMPGILGGLATIYTAHNVIPGLQIKGVLITFIVAWITGLAAGTIISLFGYRKQSYEDAVEFIVEGEHH